MCFQNQNIILTSSFSILFCSSILSMISVMLVSNTMPPITSSFRIKWTLRLKNQISRFIIVSIVTVSMWKMRSSSHTFSKHLSSVSTNTWMRSRMPSSDSLLSTQNTK